jgi:hypothetical protein
VSAWPSVQPSQFCSPLAFSSGEPFLSSTRPTVQKRSGALPHRGTSVRRKMTTTLVLLLGVVPTLVRAASMNGAQADVNPPIGSSGSSSSLSLPEVPVHGTHAVETVAGKECDGQTPTMGRATARPNRFVRSASPRRGVQCPIPPVSEQATLQENTP